MWTEAEKIHMALLERWRSAMNLVGPGPVESHFVDAAGAVEGLNARGRWVDLGSGAGFPGIALASRHPEAFVLLVESRAKRATFLKTVLRESGLSNLEVFHGRTEDVSPGFDGVISRAYRPPDLYLDDARRLLSADGVAILLSGEPPASFDGWIQGSTATYPVEGGTRVRTLFRRA